jgi:hypothetical protein
MPLSGRSELAVARVAQAGHDVADVVQALIYRGQVNCNVCMGFVESLDSLGRSDDADIFDPLGTPLLEHIRGRHRCAASGQHWVQNQTHLHGRSYR